MKKMKRVIGFLLCAAVAVSACACGSGKKTAKAEDPNTVPEDTYEIRWYMLGKPQDDVASVEKAINDYLKDKINATVKMTAMETGQYNQKMSTVVASGEYFDIAFCATWSLDYLANAALGAFVQLDDYMDTYLKDVKDTIPADYLDSARVDGKLYAIPAYKESAAQYGWIYRKDIADKYGIDMTKYKNLQDFLPVAEMLKAKEPSIQYPIDWDASSSYQRYMYNYGDFVRPVQDYNIGISYAEGADDTKIVRNQDAKLEYSGEDVYKIMREYYTKGLVKKDVATATDLNARFNSGKTFCYVAELKPGKVTEMAKSCPYEIAQAGATPVIEKSLPGLGSMMAISSTSKNPERCARFLNLLNTDPYLKNLVVHGIEGKHYEKVDDKTIRIFDDTTYSMYGYTWAIGNVFLDYISTKDDPNKLEDLKKFNENAIKREANSFSFNPEGLELTMAEISKVNKKYGSIGADGSVEVDYKATLDSLNKELDSAGLQKLIDAMQEQYTEFLKNRK